MFFCLLFFLLFVVVVIIGVTLEVTNSNIERLESISSVDVCINLVLDRNSSIELDRDVTVSIDTEPGTDMLCMY